MSYFDWVAHNEIELLQFEAELLQFPLLLLLVYTRSVHNDNEQWVPVIPREKEQGQQGVCVSVTSDKPTYNLQGDTQITMEHTFLILNQWKNF